MGLDMLRHCGLAGTAFRALLHTRLGAKPAAARLSATGFACGRPTYRTEAQAGPQPWPALCTWTPLSLPLGGGSTRRLCSVKEATLPDIALKQESSWKAVFPSVPQAAVDEFSDALLAYGATAVRRVSALPVQHGFQVRRAC